MPINFCFKNWHYCNFRSLITSVDNDSSVCYRFQPDCYCNWSFLTLTRNNIFRSPLNDTLKLKSICERTQRATQKKNTHNFCLENKLQTITGEIHQKHIRNDCFGFMEASWTSNIRNRFIGSHKIFCGQIFC